MFSFNNALRRVKPNILTVTFQYVNEYVKILRVLFFRMIFLESEIYFFVIKDKKSKYVITETLKHLYFQPGLPLENW